MLPLPPAPSPAGPLPVRVQEGLAGLCFVFEPDGARVLSKGERRRTFRLDNGNNASYSGAVVSEAIYEDLERQELRVGARWGLGKGAEAGAQFTVAARDGGVTDPLVRFWHHAIVPFSTPGQEGAPNFQSVLDVESGSTSTHLTLNGGAVALTSLALGYKKTLPAYLGRRVSLAARAALKLPLGGRSAYLDSGGVDVGAGLLAEARLRTRLYLHGNLNIVRAGKTSVGVFTGGLRTLHGSVVAAEWLGSARDSYVVQAEESEFPFVRTLQSGSGGRRQTSFGVVRTYAGGSRVRFSISENVYPFRTTAFVPDVGGSLSFDRRW